MLAALGALLPELLDLLGAFHFVEPVWWRVGYSKLKVSIFSIVHLSFIVILANKIELLLALFVLIFWALIHHFFHLFESIIEYSCSDQVQFKKIVIKSVETFL